MKYSVLILPAILAGSASFSFAVPDGAALFQQHCAMCHQAAGQGVPNVFPPLASSDFLKTQRERAIRALCEGLNGKITVNGSEYQGTMPVAVLDDVQAAAVLSHVFTNFGNAEPPAKPEEVATVRAKSKYPTFEALKQAFAFAPLPPPPPGWSLREVGQLQFSPVRLAKRTGDSKVLALALDGTIWRFDPPTGFSELVLAANSYLDPKLGSPMVQGFGWSRDGRLYLSSNQRNESVTPIMNECTIWRTEPLKPGQAIAPKPWFRTRYPWGIGGFNHGLTHIAEGPDGHIYVASGSRTDGNEPGTSDRLSKAGEDSLTACIWRLDAKMETPKLEIFCRGLRNPFGFCWAADGTLWANDNGPDADAPEELNLLKEGKHYGFPYQFSDWLQKPYPYTPEAPQELTFERPIRNQGPDAGQSTSTFDPHSSPAGILQICSAAYPENLRNSFLTVRFGNLLKKDHDVGFDLLAITPQTNGTAKVQRLLYPLARPIDLLEWQPGHLLIAEYSRGTTFAAGLGQSGRILELSVVQP